MCIFTGNPFGGVRMTPFEVWTGRFGDIEPAEFWRRSHEEAHCQQADEAVDRALAGLGPFWFEYNEPASVEEAEVLAEFLSKCVPGLALDASGRPAFS